MYKVKNLGLSMELHAFKHSTYKAETRDLCESRASLIYTTSSRPAWAIQVPGRPALLT